MQFLRQNTAAIVYVGPFYDKTDGVTPETALTITNERISLVAATDAGSAPTIILDNVTGATSGTSNDLNYITGQDNGMMQLELAAADVNRVGRVILTITDAANHCPVFHEYFILPTAIYDWLTGVTANLAVNAVQVGSQTASASGTVTFPGTIASPTNITAATGVVLSGVTHTGAVIPNVTAVTGAVGSVTGNVGGNVVGSVASVTGDVGGNVTGSVGSVVSRVTANTDQLAGQTVTAAAGVTFPTSVASPTNITAGTISTVTNLTNAPTNGDLTATMKSSITTAATAATPAVTVSDKTGFSVSGTITTLDALNTAQNVEHDATQSAIVAAKAVVDATKSVTDKLDTALELDGVVYRFTTNALEQAPTGGGAADGSGFTAIPWNPAWDAEVQSECTDALTAYAPSTLTAAGVRSAIGLATANLDTQLGDIPTVSEFNARTIVSADYATSTVAASIQSTVGDILVDTAEIGVAGAGLTNINLPDQTMNITGNLTGNVSGSVGSVTSGVTVATNSDKTGYSISGTLTTLDALDTAQDIQHSTTQSSLSTLTTTANNILADTAEIGVAGAGLTNINLPNQTMDIVGNITGNLSGSVGSVTNRVTANTDQVAGSATAATNLSKSALGIVYGTAVTGTLSTTQMSTDLTETTTDHYVGSIIAWTSGALAGQKTDVTAYNGTTKVLTYTATTDSPANGDTWVMV